MNARKAKEEKSSFLTPNKLKNNKIQNNFLRISTRKLQKRINTNVNTHEEPNNSICHREFTKRPDIARTFTKQLFPDVQNRQQKKLQT
jgi:hypothetical protein